MSPSCQNKVVLAAAASYLDFPVMSPCPCCHHVACLSVFLAHTGLKGRAAIHSMPARCFAEVPERAQPGLASRLASQLVFAWVSPLMSLGSRRQLQHDDLLDLPPELQPAECRRVLWTTWKRVGLLSLCRNRNSNGCLLLCMALWWCQKSMQCGMLVLRMGTGLTGAQNLRESL
jgi:hypothetical protein